jgi:hypothetical protein
MFNVSVSNSGCIETNELIIMNLGECGRKLLCYNLRLTQSLTEMRTRDLPGRG